VFVNRHHPSAGKENVRCTYLPATFEHLQDVKKKYDPASRFRFNVNNPPSS